MGALRVFAVAVCLDIGMAAAADLSSQCSAPEPVRDARSEQWNDSGQTQYRDYFKALLQLAQRHRGRQLGSCCNLLQPPGAQVVCPLLSVLAGKRGGQTATPSSALTREQAEWLWRWDALLLRHPDPLVSASFPSGVAAHYIDQLSVRAETSGEALAKLLVLHGYADGQYSEYISDKLMKIFRRSPKFIAANWPILREHRKSIEQMLQLYPDEVADLRVKFKRACKSPARLDCSELLAMLEPEGGRR